jgi:hypothetical protein
LKFQPELLAVLDGPRNPGIAEEANDTVQVRVHLKSYYGPLEWYFRYAFQRPTLFLPMGQLNCQQLQRGHPSSARCLFFPYWLTPSERSSPSIGIAVVNLRLGVVAFVELMKQDSMHPPSLRIDECGEYFGADI